MPKTVKIGPYTNSENKGCAMSITSKLYSIALIGICLASIGCPKPGATPPPQINKDWAITVSLNYDFTNFVPCSSTVTKGCISGFTWGYLQGSTQVPVKTSPASICSGTVQPETCIDTGNS